MFAKSAYCYVQETPLRPVPLANETLSATGRNPQKKAIVISLPTIESSFTQHTAKGITGFGNPEFPALRLALEVLNATESFLWVSIREYGTDSLCFTCPCSALFVDPVLHTAPLSAATWREAS